MLFQYASTSTVCGAIERVVGRKVRAFVSGMDYPSRRALRGDLILHPEDYEGPSRGELGEG